MFKLFHGAPYAVCVELKNLYLFVFCLLWVWGCEGVGVVVVATYGSLCDGDMWGESGRVGYIRSRV